MTTTTPNFRFGGMGMGMVLSNRVSPHPITIPVPGSDIVSVVSEPMVGDSGDEVNFSFEEAITPAAALPYVPKPEHRRFQRLCVVVASERS